MKCGKNHVEIEWNDKELFCCPLCTVKEINDNLREVRNFEEQKLNQIIQLAQEALRFNR